MTRKQSRPSFATLDPQKIKAICDALQGDGHGIYYPAMLIDLEVPAEYIDPLTITFKSDKREHKSTIYAPGGTVVDELRGIGALMLYETIASDLGLPGSDAMGRGFRAQTCHSQITEWCRSKMSEHAARTT